MNLGDDEELRACGSSRPEQGFIGAHEDIAHRKCPERMSLRALEYLSCGELNNTHSLPVDPLFFSKKVSPLWLQRIARPWVSRRLALAIPEYERSSCLYRAESYLPLLLQIYNTTGG